MRRLYAGVLALVLVTHFGCGAIQEPGWRKPWGKGALIPAIVCGLGGAGLGVWIQDERTGTSRLTIVNPDTHQQSVSEVEDDAEYWKGALVGFPAGAVLCGVLGHIFFDPAAPAPPPPPPPSPKGEELLPGGVAVKARKRIVLRGVNFDFDRADIRPDSAPVLDEAARIIAEMKSEIEQLVVEGHTDSLGTDEYNLALSIRRAEAVYRYLVNQGVPPEIMRIEGYGESQPVADNAKEEGRAQNRRVELKVIQVKTIPAVAPAGSEETPAAEEPGVTPEEAPEESAPAETGGDSEQEVP
jgi:outer membrane protein OmpA-like peptidoglycan-associated protein